MVPAVGEFSEGKDLIERFALVGGAVLGHRALQQWSVNHEPESTQTPR